MSSKRTNNPQRRILTQQEIARAMIYSVWEWDVYPAELETTLIELQTLMTVKQVNDVFTTIFSAVRSKYEAQS